MTTAIAKPTMAKRIDNETLKRLVTPFADGVEFNAFLEQAKSANLGPMTMLAAALGCPSDDKQKSP
jgi:hypothetical protein